MKRTKTNLPDAINCSYSTNFTQISNDLLRNSELSWKAKGIICTLLSNRKGWKSYAITMQSLSKDGKDSLNSGLQELERLDYLLRIKYRDKKTKQIKGTIWIYTDTPGNFNMHQIKKRYKKTNYELISPTKKATTGFSGAGFSGAGKSAPNNNNNKNTNIREEDKSSSMSKQRLNGYITPSKFEHFWKLYPRKDTKGAAFTKWNEICRRKQNRPKWDEIKTAIQAQIKTERWQDPEFIPLPTTWLNQSRWLDDPSQMKLFKNKRNSTLPKKEYSI